ncbi:MAG: Stp1/IreP family PP2C-type Ser/Thr phosphatase [Candidatus Limivicinus sp.]|nr:Stp1/IreP family PP2C-type Ser/Thr phosphatase [Clostridiales bacterium]MCI7136748.1 Stp1/IreP family PP2C-type Ser/Thr phosphatase [Clostridiales bacterium]MDY6133977.1 Stp1/IreP family PP2C-type Ser/Thr phosphatase [Candidatus Limivicinus sp.]
MKSFGLTDKGKVRKDNQDSFIIEKCDAKDCLVVALCDGMGGAKAGGLASQLSNKAFVSYIYAKLTSRVNRALDFQKILRDACTEANGVAYEYSQFDEEYNGMGTTIVGGVVKSNGNGYIINVGDSRAYHISRRLDCITQITRDHSLVEELVEYGAITKEQAKTHPQRNVITRALGSEAQVEADYFEFSLQGGDFLLLCSDGLSNIVSDEEILAYAKEYPEPELLCRSLMSKALNRGAGDNVTVLAVMK